MKPMIDIIKMSEEPTQSEKEIEQIREKVRAIIKQHNIENIPRRDDIINIVYDCCKHIFEKEKEQFIDEIVQERIGIQKEDGERIKDYKMQIKEMIEKIDKLKDEYIQHLSGLRIENKNRDINLPLSGFDGFVEAERNWWKEKLEIIKNEKKGGFALISECCGSSVWHKPEDCPQKVEHEKNVAICGCGDHIDSEGSCWICHANKVSDAKNSSILKAMKIVDDLENLYPKDIFLWNNKEVLDFNRGRFNRHCFEIVENTKKKIKEEMEELRREEMNHE
jgi:hypothetical protein